MKHFEVAVRAGPKNGLRLVREEYARINRRSTSSVRREDAAELWDAMADCFEDEEHHFYAVEWADRWRAMALENFDLNMAFFASLDADEFEDALQRAVKTQRGMVEVFDLNEWEGKAGIYLMVLDGYKQAYVGTTGTSNGIMKRIRQHWSTTKAFDRLLFGAVEESILAVDSFRALDTTRIFAARARDPWLREMRLVESIPRRFLLNRLMGGEARALGFASSLGVEIKRTRSLIVEEQSPQY